jgi:membrane protein implicated in regulation of membrane protease activity
MTFVSLIAAGLAYVAISWLFGQFGGGDGDDHDHSHTHQGHDGHDEQGHTTVKIFSPKLISVFLIGLGAGGTLATVYGLDAIFSTLIGIASGFALGGTMFLFFKALYSQQSNSSLIIDRALGHLATVNIGIPTNGSGEVGLSLNGQYITCFARSRDNQAIGRGTSVKVSSVEGSTLVVESIQHA